MSRKTSQTVLNSARGATKLSAIDVGHKHVSVGRLDDHNQRYQLSSKAPDQVQVTDVSRSGGSMESSSDDGEADEEDGNGEAAKEDEEEEVEDPDVQAPSDRAAESTAHQAGRSNPSSVLLNYNRNRAPRRTKTDVQVEDSSNDEAYKGVDLISDSDGDESDMDCVEERAIIDSEDDGAGQITSTSRNEHKLARGRSQSGSSDISWEGFDFGDGSLSGHQDFFDEQFDRTDFDGFSTEENDILGDINIFGDSSLHSPSSPSKRRVRFAEPLLEDPVIDTQISSVMQGLARDALSVDIEPLPHITKTAIECQGSGRDSDSESGSSSGYETDYGETTDEDDLPALATARPQSLIRQPSASSANAFTSSTPFGKSMNQRCGPRMGSWCIDPTKPIAMVDSCGKKLLICPARRPKKPDRVFEHILGSASTSVNTSPRTQVSTMATVPNSDIEPSEMSSQELASPMFSTLPTARLGLLTNSIFADDTDHTGCLDDRAILYDDIEDNDDDDEDEHENGINIEDLIDFGDDGDSELDLPFDDSRPTSSSLTTICPSNVGRSTSQTLFDHLDSIDVTAFRQTQLPAPASLSPLSPLKKRKLSPPLGGPSKRRLVA